MKTRTLTVLSLLNDLRHAGFDAFKRKHKNPSLLLFYSFIDICASLSSEMKEDSPEIFEKYLKTYALTHWKRFSAYDLWSARCSLLHSYSPLGFLTKKKSRRKKGSAKPIFYYSWPETPEQMTQALTALGYSDFLLLNVGDIKALSVTAFNGMCSRIENDADFEEVFLRNSKHVLSDLYYFKLEEELSVIAKLTRLREEGQ